MALLLAGFGLSEADSRAAAALPGPVSLAVSAYARAADPMVEAARAAGHELLASVPMEPERLGVDDPGPLALLTGAPPAANQARLEQVMGRFQGYAGLTGVSDGLVGGRFAGQPSGMSQLTAEVGRRGLFWVDPRPRGAEQPTADMPGPAVDIVLDEGDPPSRAGIEGRLAALERLARQRGAALGVAVRLRPVTLELVGAWARDAQGDLLIHEDDIGGLSDLSRLGEFVFDKRQGQRASAKKHRRNRHYEKQFIRNTLAHLPAPGDVAELTTGAEPGALPALD